MNESLEQYFQKCQSRVDAALLDYLQGHTNPCPRLLETMQYGLFNGGKRIRPVLAYAAAEAMGVSMTCADVPACALECLHAYSLIHDDLPAMDDDDLRRGKPTCHKAFDEASAILAGDALQSLAFEMLAGSSALRVSDAVRVEMISSLAQAAGWRGMVAGQSLDCMAAGAGLAEVDLEKMHDLKTGALIRASVKLGALASGNAQADQLARLDQYARHIGLAFQVWDDVLDEMSDTVTLGKRQGRDRELDKPTYVSVLGIEAATAKARQLYHTALSALDVFGDNAWALREIATFIVHRSH
jgi:geranylgeranyl pyrophosphate synthase